MNNVVKHTRMGIKLLRFEFHKHFLVIVCPWTAVPQFPHL